MITTITIFTIIAYTLTWCLIARQLWQRIQQQGKRNQMFIMISWSIAILLHGIILYHPLLANEQGLMLNFSSALSHVSWFSSLLLFITLFKRQVISMGILSLAFSVLALILTLILSHSSATTIQLKEGLGIHIFVSFLAYSMLALATIQALLLAYQNKHLHNHHPGGFIKTLPSLQDMESLLFRFILFGVVLLSLSLISGFFFFENLFGQGIAHKTLLSIFAWFIFSILLIGHWQYGWRGRTAIRGTISGFVLLMLAYFGSKFIFEFITS